jgi:Zn-dependent protease
MFSGFFSPEWFMTLLYSLPAILIALSFHEFSHALAAYRMGDPTAKNAGRLTLDPVRHLDLIGTICIVLFRFGWAKPVPINPRNFKQPKSKQQIVTAFQEKCVTGLTVNMHHLKKKT